MWRNMEITLYSADTIKCPENQDRLVDLLGTH